MSVAKFVLKTLEEDVGRGDLYCKVAQEAPYKTVIKANSSGVLAGELYVMELCRQNNINITFNTHDGNVYKNGDIIATLEGTNHKILVCERSILNILQHASGIASNVRQYSDITDNYNVKLLDTRKTRPLLREFEKYASLIGGAINHRMGLDDALMIKDTHRKSIDDLELFIYNARKKIPFTAKIELECENIEQAVKALCLDIDIIMCDNMSVADVAHVVSVKRERKSSVLLEVSGGIHIGNLEDYCKTGIDAVSIGSLIHQAHWQDFSMKGIS